MATAAFLPPKDRRLRPSCKFDLGVALKMRVQQHQSYAAIARQLGVNVKTITSKLRQFAHLMDDPDMLTASMSQYDSLIDSAKLKALVKLSTKEKLDKSSASQLAVIFGILDDKARLEKGQSTQNVKHLALIIQAAHRSPGVGTAASAHSSGHGEGS